MENRKNYIAIYIYIKSSLIIYLSGLASLPFILIFDAVIPNAVEIAYFVVMACCVPVFFILPGIIYEGKYKGAFHGITADQFRYSLFLGLTLGIGPALSYFIKYDALLKKMINPEKGTGTRKEDEGREKGRP